MKHLFLVFFCIFLYENLYSQNRLYEGNFEAGASVWGCNHYDDINNRFNYWNTEFSNKALYRKYSLLPKIWQSAGWETNNSGLEADPDCPCGAYHSPDYRGANNDPQGHYIGIGQYELIQQKLTSSNKLEEGKFYKVSYKINIPEFFNGTGHVTTNSERYLVFFLAKNKVKYKRQGREFTGNSSGENICNSTNIGFGYIRPYNQKYKNYKSIEQDTILLKKIKLNNFSFDTWYNMSFAFRMPEEGINKHNWFVIDCIDDGSCGESFCINYAYIDDIILEETEQCNTEEPCSLTDGYINPKSMHFVTPENSNIIIDGLENVSLAKNMRITGMNGAVDIILPDKYCPNGIDSVNWSGRSAGGAPLAAGMYLWEMDFYNDCDYRHIRALINLPNLTAFPALPDNFECNESILQPLPCCEAEPNILIENETIEGSGEVLFHAVNNITIRNTLIKSTATDVTFKAGNEIVLEPGFETQEGANVEMLIEPCDDKQQEKKDSLNTKRTLISKFLNPDDTIPTYSDDKGLKTEINIFPNPANKYFELSLRFLCNQNITDLNISISNISGKMFYDNQFKNNNDYFNTRINTGSFPAGIYLVKITSNQFSETKKLIIQ